MPGRCRLMVQMCVLASNLHQKDSAMIQLHHVRRSRALTFLDLAQLTGLPARMIAAAEYGFYTLSPQEAQCLATALDLADAALLTQPLHLPTQPAAHTLPPFFKPTWTIGLLLFTLLLSFGILHLLPFVFPDDAQAATGPRLAAVSTANEQEYAPLSEPDLPISIFTPIPTATALASPTPIPTNLPQRLVAHHAQMPAPTITPSPTATPLPTETPVPTPTATFILSEAGPIGCPLQPSVGRVVMTQGYGVGSHAPADVWGAVDLAVVGNGYGRADRDATLYTPVVATHSGIAQVTLDSWPGGNHVWVEDPLSGWRTGYAHLAFVIVTDGQEVQAGTYLGLAGSTGESSGPHLDYQVWYGGTNIDPTNLVRVCQ